MSHVSIYRQTCESACDMGVSRPLTLGVPRPLTLAETMSDRLSFSLSRSEPTEWLDAASEIASKLSLVADDTHSDTDEQSGAELS